jgi:putative nucleotidyltransferase with HDIG domain
MKKIPNPPDQRLRGFLQRLLKMPRMGRIPGIICICSFLAAVIVTITNLNLSSDGPGDINKFEIGKVADRDVIAEHSLSYIDNEATMMRVKAQENMVPAVFRYSENPRVEAIESWDKFCDLADKLVAEGSSRTSRQMAIQAEYRDYFTNETINAYFTAHDRPAFRAYGEKVLDSVLEKGVFTMDYVDLGSYNPDLAELIVSRGDRVERERVSYSGIITMANASDAITQVSDSEQMPDDFRDLAVSLLLPFVRENVFFSMEDSRLRVTQAKERVPPVMKHIEKGKRIIKKGFVISNEEIQELQALYAAHPKKDPRSIIGLVLLLLLLYVLFLLLQEKIVMGREFSGDEQSLLFILVFLYLAGAGLVKSIAPSMNDIPVSLMFPTALIVMIPAVFMGPQLALTLALALPLGACLAGFFDMPAYIFALISGVAASVVLKGAETRMDIIKAGLTIAAANCIAIVVILLMRAAAFAEYPSMLLWAAINGIVSGMLVLGVLPPLEHVMKAATTFRLIELSDLNAPILRKLFTTAPGTYSHSLMVATLAEQACQDIGANALLARVGGYYHDIGKMDNPDYFIENQTDHNRHDDIAPRLSATVIRSHLKLGVEKARALGLPADVIDIIAEHHGNSLILWFYKKASQQEDQVNSDDFAYPGTPPHSRESAVVMLADVTEAAVRTMVKPTVAKMEKFIQQLFDQKVEAGQLTQSDLTFRDLETIKKAFIKVLAGYYHSRIEYPKEEE